MKKATIALLLICTAVFAQQKGTFTDSRDGKKYKTAKIGTQTWMAENLNYNAKDSKCYDNDETNCDKYGRLYDWKTATSACPAGWHLPDKSEYEILDKAVGGEKKAVKKLKTKSGWYSNGNGTDDYGFSAMPGGFGNSVGNFSNMGYRGFWWSASEFNSNNSSYRVMYYALEISRWLNYYKSNLYSVRCVMD